MHEWWNEELVNILKRKMDAFSKYLGTTMDRDWEEYMERCKGVKREVKREKKENGVEN